VKEGDDEIQFESEIAPGVYSALRRSPDGEIRQITCSPTQDGAPVRPGAELANVSAESRDGWRKLTSLYKAAGDGPAQVATPAYREGYDRIFGKQKVGLA
jgi:hypothetical protein